MANLAIKGHAIHRNEVIEILEMLGGINRHKFKGDEDEWFVLNRFIQRSDRLFDEKGFTLEEFLEKFPYKVGDKVIYENIKREITKMVWEEHTNTVAYKLDDKLYCNVIKELQPYKEETMEENIKEKCDLINFNSHYIFNFADKVELILKDDWEVKNEDGRTYVVRKQPQYPKNLEECCKIIKTLPHTRNGVSGYASGKLWTLQKLLICRDAYWKIAGDWKPDVMYCDLYCIGYDGNVITWKMQGGCRFLVFPTEEMRDSFYENFKDLIEQCKELL